MQHRRQLQIWVNLLIILWTWLCWIMEIRQGWGHLKVLGRQLQLYQNQCHTHSLSMVCMLTEMYHFNTIILHYFLGAVAAGSLVVLFCCWCCCCWCCVCWLVFHTDIMPFEKMSFGSITKLLLVQIQVQTLWDLWVEGAWKKCKQVESEFEFNRYVKAG